MGLPIPLILHDEEFSERQRLDPGMLLDNRREDSCLQKGTKPCIQAGHGLYGNIDGACVAAVPTGAPVAGLDSIKDTFAFLPCQSVRQNVRLVQILRI